MIIVTIVYVFTDQEIFIWNAIEERRFHPTFCHQPPTKINCFHSKLGTWFSIGEGKNSGQGEQVKKPYFEVDTSRHVWMCDLCLSAQ